MRKHLLALSASLLAFAACMAGDDVSLIVNYLDGSEYSAALATVGRVNLTDGKIVIETNDGATNPVGNISDVRSIVFGKRSSEDQNPTLIPEVLRNEVTVSVYPNPSAGMVKVSGLPEGSDVRVFDLQGRPVLSATAPSVDLTPLKPGVYLLQAGPEVVQIIRK